MDQQEGAGRRVALEATRGRSRRDEEGIHLGAPNNTYGTLVGCFSCYRVSERRTGVLLTANRRYIEI